MDWGLVKKKKKKNFPNYLVDYRIYSCISREILDQIREFFFPFNLYTGQQQAWSQSEQVYIVGCRSVDRDNLISDSP